MAYTDNEQALITSLRTSISHLASGSNFTLPAVSTDDELYNDLILGISMWNSYPPYMATYTLDTIIPGFYGSLSLCAQFFAGVRLQWFETGKHFQYSDNGISLTRDRQGKYNSIAGQLITAINAILPLQKKMMALSQPGLLKGQFSSTIAFPRSLTRGLRGTRLGFD